jgi:uncharacterized damage-inducible protein DinB
MNIEDVFEDAFGRIRHGVHEVLEGLTFEQLTFRADPEANTIAWLVWHLTRVQDDHVAHVAGSEQVWTSGGWVERFDLPFDPAAIGYGQSPGEVGEVKSDAGLLGAYHDAVYEQTVSYIEQLTASDLDRVVDERWDPPVTLGARLVSVIEDDLQHVGQAAFTKGISERRARP